MIKAEHGHVARYEATEGNHKPRNKDIVAWADDGHPMVVGSKGLVRADSFPGYFGVDLNGEPRVLSFLSGNGWMVERPDGSRDPLVAWAMCTYGSGVFGLPVFTEEHGVRNSEATWTGATMGGDPDPVTVVPETPSDRA